MNDELAKKCYFIVHNYSSVHYSTGKDLFPNVFEGILLELEFIIHNS